jgi:hypothetical protein
MARIVPMERTTIRSCEARDRWSDGYRTCGKRAASWVETDWRGARRVASLNGSNTARFTQRRPACSDHTAIVERILSIAK